MSEMELNVPQNVDQESIQSEVKQPALGPGAQLAVHRQELGLTVEQVANQLNLAPRQIQALEIDNYAALPGTVIARGFVRAYAKLLKVEPTPLVSMMPGEVVQMESLQLKRALSGSFSESHLPTVGGNRLLSRTAVGITFVALVVVSVVLMQWFGLLEGVSESVTGQMEKSVTLLSDQASSTTTILESRIVAPVSAPTSNAVLDAPMVTAANVIETPISPPVITSVSSTQPEARKADPVVLDNEKTTMKNFLVVKVREDSWVEVKDSNDVVLISRLMLAGTTEMLTATKPIFLTIGNVAGVEVTFRGNPVDLTTTAKNNIVRLNLK